MNLQNNKNFKQQSPKIKNVKQDFFSKIQDVSNIPVEFQQMKFCYGSSGPYKSLDHAVNDCMADKKNCKGLVWDPERKVYNLCDKDTDIKNYLNTYVNDVKSPWEDDIESFRSDYTNYYLKKLKKKTPDSHRMPGNK